MMTPIATRFVYWDIPEPSTLQDSKVYKLRVQLNEGTPMSRQQKNWQLLPPFTGFHIKGQIVKAGEVVRHHQQHRA